jgi:hypothetical protein
MPFIKQNIDNIIFEEECAKIKPFCLQTMSKKFKKITGSRFASVLNLSKYNSPFKM